ncbi:MAG: HAMP domain-containing histidine kinase [Ruminococcus flavefaciens]|nr:HAMP domain-containing histidine kinase [Ruminococcus flavefaciens]
MDKSKSSYYRLARYVYIVILTMLVVIGVIVVTVSSAMYKNEKLTELQDTGNLFIGCIKEEYKKEGRIDSKLMHDFHGALLKEKNIEAFIYDADGNCVVSPNDYEIELSSGKFNFSKSTKDPEPLSDSMLEALEDDYYLELDKNGYSKNEPRLTYGRRIFLKTDDSGIPVRMYAVFYGVTNSINSFILKITLYYLLIALVIAIAAYLIIRRRMKKLESYEEEFLRIAAMYAKGNFSETISTDFDGGMKEIAEYVNALASNIENSEDTSKTFIANVSHELRTPITTVGGFVDGILDGTIPKARQNEYLVLVSKEIHRLKILISSMLNMTKYESGSLVPNFREANITDLVIQTVLMFEKKIEAKQLDVFGLDSGRLNVYIDVDLMQQVIYNLVENAVKFVDQAGTLVFRFDKTEEWYEIGIKNTGEGLKDSEIQQVFDRFYKTDSSRGKDTTGLGLGLSISRKIVHLHKGHIVVKSVYGEYTEFIIQLPIIDKKPKQ